MIAPNVLKKVKVEGAWKFLPVWKIGDKWDWTKVKLHGCPMVATEGTFYLQYREGGRNSPKITRAIGTHPRDAKIALATQMSVIDLRQQGMTVDDAPQLQAYRPISGPRINDVVTSYIANPPLKLRIKSRSKYNNALLSFSRWTTKTHLSQLGRDDLNSFMSHLVDKEGLDHSTALDKGHVVHAVMNDLGADIRMKKGDWPKVTEVQRESYDPSVLKKLFAAADRDEFILFQTFLMTGFRDQEVGFLSWDDFNPRMQTLSVTKKKALGFDPKNYQERTIPIPLPLVELLKEQRKRQGRDEYLIFATSTHNEKRGCPGGQRDKHMLDRLKKLAFRNELNCGQCDGRWNKQPATCADRPICKRFGLHMFRHTYATTLLHDGVDLVSLQKLLGHSDLESTRKYLRALDPAALLTKINLTSIATRFQ